jgi:hypothetical protein
MTQGEPKFPQNPERGFIDTVVRETVGVTAEMDPIEKIKESDRIIARAEVCRRTGFEDEHDKKVIEHRLESIVEFVDDPDYRMHALKILGLLSEE